MTAKRDPNGRNAGATSLARYFREQTNNLEEIGDILLGIARNEDEPKLQLSAIKIILDRAIGMPVQAVELQAKIERDDKEQVAALDISSMSRQELEQAYDIFCRLTGAAPAGAFSARLLASPDGAAGEGEARGDDAGEPQSPDDVAPSSIPAPTTG